MESERYTVVDDYIGALFAPQDDVLLAARSSLEEAGMPQISVSPNQGKLLHVLALACNARKVLEIGTLGGYSTIWLARALPADGRLITLELDPSHAEVARGNIARAGLSNIVDIRVGKAMDLLPVLEQERAGPFDLVFIDADKPPYPEYLRAAMRLSRPGTLIVADNVIRGGRVMDRSSSDGDVTAVGRFNEILAADTALAATVIQTVGLKGHDGMAVAVVKRR